MQVFLSYSHEDGEFAQYITTALRTAGVNVWFDRERMIAGAGNLPQIIAAARDSDHGLFVVSRSWLTKSWTLKELSLFESRDLATSRRIAVVRTRLRDIRDELPPALTDISAIEWLLEDRQPDARLWQVYCAVQGRECGAEDQWVACGRALLAAATSPVTPPAAPPRAIDPPSMFCGRAEQWSQVGQVMRQPSHHLLLLTGARGQAHDVFINRVQLEIQSAQILRVPWQWRPAGEQEFREALAHALGVHAGAVAAELSGQASHRSVLLVHDNIRDEFDDPELVSYYAAYVPALLDEARPAMPVHWLQPVEWLESSLASRITGWFVHGHPSRDRGRAQALVARLAQIQGSPLRSRLLPELKTITEDEIASVCDAYGLEKDAVQRLEKRISAGARTSSEKLAILDEFMRDRRRPRKDPYAGQLHLAPLQG